MREGGDRDERGGGRVEGADSCWVMGPLKMPPRALSSNFTHCVDIIREKTERRMRISTKSCAVLIALGGPCQARMEARALAQRGELVRVIRRE